MSLLIAGLTMLSSAAQPPPLSDVAGTLLNGPVVFDHILSGLPVEMARDGVGVGRVMLTINSTGRAVRCQIIKSLGIKEFDKSVCRSWQRMARFSPWVDETGKPIFASKRLTVKVSIGERSKPQQGSPPEDDLIVSVKALPGGRSSARVLIREIVAVDGTVESCAVHKSSELPAIDRIACQSAAPLVQVGPVLDGEDKPVRAVRLSNIGFEVEKQPQPSP